MEGFRDSKVLCVGGHLDIGDAIASTASFNLKADQFTFAAVVVYEQLADGDVLVHFPTIFKGTVENQDMNGNAVKTSNACTMRIRSNSAPKWTICLRSYGNCNSSNHISLIKEIRSASGCGLKEAKDMADGVRDGHQVYLPIRVPHDVLLDAALLKIKALGIYAEVAVTPTEVLSF